MVTINVKGFDATDRLLSVLPTVARVEASKQAAIIAADEASRIRTRARASGRQAALAARSVRADGGARPGITAGGSGRVPGTSSNYGQLFFGAEFGGRGRPSTQQFRPYQGTRGSWFWPQLRDDEQRIFNRWHEVLDKISLLWERT